MEVEMFTYKPSWLDFNIKINLYYISTLDYLHLSVYGVCPVILSGVKKSNKK